MTPSQWLTRHVLMDLTPLRRSRDYRALISGLGVSTLGNQLTQVAVPFQVYALSHSSLYVGLASLAQLFPLIIGSLLGGSLVDSYDRRKLLLGVESLAALMSVALAVNSDLGPALWPLFVFPSVTAALSGVDSASRNAMVPSMVGMEMVPSANAIFQALNQLGTVVGPAAAGLLLAGAGVKVVYWIDVASYAVALIAVLAISPQRPAGSPTRPGWRSMVEGFKFVGRSQPLQGAYVIDVNAMVFGMPRALFPALGLTVFGGGATAVGLLYAAPGAGALIGAVTTGWVTRVRRQGLAVIAAVALWGVAIAAFGLVRWLPLALLLLAVAGWADVISAVFRNTIIQFETPDNMRGRMMGVQMAVVTGGPRLGDLESGAVANAFGDTTAVVSGGLACLAGALLLARLLPRFRRHEYLPPAAAEPDAPDADAAGTPTPSALCSRSVSPGQQKPRT